MNRRISAAVVAPRMPTLWPLALYVSVLLPLAISNFRLRVRVRYIKGMVLDGDWLGLNGGVGTWQLPVYLPLRLCVFISSLTAVGRVLLHGQRRPACAQAPVNVATIAVPVLELVPSVLPPLLVQVPAPLPPIRLSAAVAASAGPARDIDRDRPAAILVAVNSSRSTSVRPAQAPLAALVQLRPPGGGCTGFVMTSGNSTHCLTAN
jgi:hypothetical protein